jgi:hypothetical protein
MRVMFGEVNAENLSVEREFLVYLDPVSVRSQSKTDIDLGSSVRASTLFRSVS